MYRLSRRKREVFHQVSAELKKLGVTRTWAECRAKVKNLKGEYRKAREANSCQMFKFFNLMETVLNSAPAHNRGPNSGAAFHPQKLQDPAVPLEFKILPQSDTDFRNLNDQIPLPEDGTLMVPSTIENVEPESDYTQTQENHQRRLIPHQHSSNMSTEVRALDAESGASVIVIATTEAMCDSRGATQGEVTMQEGPSKTNWPKSGHKDSLIMTGKRTTQVAPNDLTQKRRKLHSLSEKMAETVDRVLTRTTEALMLEFKASEDRFMEWEEKKRFEEQEREEKLLKTFVDAIKNTATPEEIQRKASLNQEKEARERERTTIQSSDDPCAATFDILANRLTTMLTDQQRELEQALFQWETKMQKKEMKHTENIFNMILSAVRTNPDNETNI